MLLAWQTHLSTLLVIHLLPSVSILSLRLSSLLVLISLNPSIDNHVPFVYVPLVSTCLLLKNIVQTWLLLIFPCVTLWYHQCATPPSSFPHCPVCTPHMGRRYLGWNCFSSLLPILNKIVVRCSEIFVRIFVTYWTVPLPPFYIKTYSMQSLVSILTNKSATFYFNIIITSSSDPMCIYNTGIYIVATYLPMCVYMVQHDQRADMYWWEITTGMYI